LIFASYPIEEEAMIESDFFAQTRPVPLATLAHTIHMTTAQLKSINWELQKKGIPSGIKKTESGWVVIPATFHAHFYSKLTSPLVRYAPSDWDGNDLLNEPGIFFLRDVCDRMPFTPNQLRYQSQQHSEPRRVIGIWKDPQRDAYLVDMSVFAPWIARIWAEKTQNPSPIRRQTHARERRGNTVPAR
jgi:hypothetical protein